jgi:hypothetical protein
VLPKTTGLSAKPSLLSDEEAMPQAAGEWPLAVLVVVAPARRLGGRPGR